MRNFRERLSQFMIGRYGADQLYSAMVAVSFALLLINFFVKSPVIGAIVWLILVLALDRSLSRNIYRRQMENQRFLKIWNPVKSRFSLTGRKLTEIKTHRYVKCPKCKANLRLKRRPGTLEVHCPRCNNQFRKRILF